MNLVLIQVHLRLKIPRRPKFTRVDYSPLFTIIGKYARGGRIIGTVITLRLLLLLRSAVAALTAVSFTNSRPDKPTR